MLVPKVALSNNKMPAQADPGFDHEKRHQKRQQHFQQYAGRGEGELFDHRRAGQHDLTGPGLAGEFGQLSVYCGNPCKFIAQLAEPVCNLLRHGRHAFEQFGGRL